MSSQDEWDKIKKEQDAYGRSAYLLDQQEERSIQIIPDENISPAKFLPDPQKVGFFRAHPLTIQAMKKDIFLLGDDVHFTMLTCRDCSKAAEKECWNICPYCGGLLHP